MNKYIYGFGTAAVALAMSVAPLSALAESNGGAEQGQDVKTQKVEVQTQERAQVQTTAAPTAVTAGVKPSIQGAGDEEQGGGEMSATGPSRAEDATEQEFEGLMDDEAPVGSIHALTQKIEAQTQKSQDVVASTSPANQMQVEARNQARIATNSLIVSKDLLGNVGSQVSELAKQVKDSAASTTDAEAQIQARGFFTRFFFGGDKAAAGVITQEVAQNQQRIDDLTKLLGQANVSADIQTTLKAQIVALQDAETRLQDLAQKEQGMWGIFSWRF